MTSLRRSAILIAFLFFSFSLGCNPSTHKAEFIPSSIEGSGTRGKVAITVPLSDEQSASYTSIDECVREPFLLEQLTFASDAHMHEYEFSYLTGLHEGQKVGAQQLKHACQYLAKKRKFETVTITMSPGVEGKRVHVDLQGQLTFRTLIFHGMLLGKDTYKRFYVLEPGDIFDRAQHVHALEKMNEAFKEQGYFNATVKDRVDRDETTKSVTVHVWLSSGPRFVINEAHVELNQAEGIDQEEVHTAIDGIIIKAMRGSAYTKELIDTKTEELGRLLAQRGFINPTIELEERIDYQRHTVALSLTISLYKKKEFIFFGNHFYTNEQLLDKVLLFGKAAWLLPPTLLAQELAQAYHEKGFWDVHIEPQDEDNRHFFLIKEGNRASVAQIKLNGVNVFDPKLLVKRYFSRVRRRRYFDKGALKSALHNLMTLYRKNGFWDAKVLQKDFAKQNRNKYELAITIDEGVQRLISSATVENYPELNSEGPFVTYDGPVPFDARLLDEQRRWLIRHFQQEGYLYVQVTPTVAEVDNVSSITWHVDLVTDKVRFGKTVLIGSSTVPLAMILKELRYSAGDVWDKKKLTASLARLRELGLFEHVYLYPEQLAVPEEEKIILLKLIKDEPFEVRLHGGIGLHRVGDRSIVLGSPTYKLGGSFVYKEPFGYGDQLCLDTDFTRSHRKFAATYSWPWFLQRPLRAHLKAYFNQYGHPGFIIERKNLYEVLQEGVLMGLEGKHSCCSYGINIGLEWMKTTIKEEDIGINNLVAQLSQAIHLSPDIIDKRVPYLFAEPSLFIDYLDDKLNPTRGTLTVLSCKGMFPVSRTDISSYLIKMQFEHSIFFPVCSAVVLGLRLRAGHIFNQLFDQIMPTERFYLGGANSVRGYQTDLAPPLGVFTDDNGTEHTVPQGGKTMLNFNVEGRFSLYNNFGFVLFQDIGLLIEDELSVSIGERLVAATGAGIRYNTPIGPLRFDIGFKWRKVQPGNARYAWFLAFGHAF